MKLKRSLLRYTRSAGLFPGERVFLPQKAAEEVVASRKRSDSDGPKPNELTGELPRLMLAVRAEAESGSRNGAENPVRLGDRVLRR